MAFTFAPRKQPQGGGPVSSEYLRVPSNIDLEGETLVWSFDPSSAPREVKPTDRMLNAFLRLAAAPSDRILSFARRYGVFGAVLVETDSNAVNESSPLALDEIEALGKRWRIGERPQHCSEPVALWREISSGIGAMLEISEYLNRRPPVKPPLTLWHSVGAFKDNAVPSVEDAQWLFSGLLNEWLQRGGITLRAEVREWSTRETVWETHIAYRGDFKLFGALLLQMFLAITGAESLMVCSGCRLPYIRSSKAPNPKARNYCDDCGTQRALKDADVRRKRRIVEARQLRQDGKSIEEIATMLGAKIETIQGWVKEQA